MERSALIRENKYQIQWKKEICLKNGISVQEYVLLVGKVFNKQRIAKPYYNGGKYNG
jgi:hypothetical protein